MVTESEYDLDAEYANFKDTASIRRSEYFDSAVSKVISGDGGIPCTFSPGLRFRPGEVTLIAGANGDGKSLIVGQIAKDLALTGHGVCIESLEMSPGHTLHRMLRQDLKRIPTQNDIHPWIETIGQKLCLLDYVGTATPSLILGCAIAANRDFGVEFVVVDNLATVVSAEDDYTGQKMFVIDCKRVARALGIHIIIVHHVRKGADEEKVYDKTDIKGGGGAVDMADNAVIFQRNRKKERQIRNQEAVDDASIPDAWMRTCKQREGDWEGVTPLWYEPNGKNYCLKSSRVPPAVLSVLTKPETADDAWKKRIMKAVGVKKEEANAVPF